MAITPSSYENGLVIEDLTLETQPSKTWAMQLDGDRCVGTTDGVNALVQSIFCMLNTEKGVYSIYPNTYGLQTQDLYGKPAPYIYAVLCDRIRDAIMTDDRVEDVGNFSYTYSGDSMEISYSVYTNFTDDEIRSAYNVR